MSLPQYSARVKNARSYLHYHICINGIMLNWAKGLYHLYVVKVKQGSTGLDRPLGFQEDEAPRFQDTQHMKVVGLSALHTGHLYSQEIFLVLISVRGWVDPRTIVQPKGLCWWKIPVIPSEIKPATFRPVAQIYTWYHGIFKCMSHLFYCIQQYSCFDYHKACAVEFVLHISLHRKTSFSWSESSPDQAH
jgi:hypothetical protein